MYTSHRLSCRGFHAYSMYNLKLLNYNLYLGVFQILKNLLRNSFTQIFYFLKINIDILLLFFLLLMLLLLSLV